VRGVQNCRDTTATGAGASPSAAMARAWAMGDRRSWLDRLRWDGFDGRCVRRIRRAFDVLEGSTSASLWVWHLRKRSARIL
jgi:hypothetical protein